MPVLQALEARPFEVRIEAADQRLGIEAIRHEPKIAPYSLYSFQDKALGHLRGQKNSALISSAGMGKSMLAICAGADALADGAVERVIVLTHSALSYHVGFELTSLGLQEEVFCATGPMGPRWRGYNTTPSRWIVVPYTMLIRDVDVLTALMPTSMLIVDSVSQIKNAASASALATRQLAERARRTLTTLSPCHHYKYEQWDYLITQAVDPIGTRFRPALAAALRTRFNVGDTSMVTITQRD